MITKIYQLIKWLVAFLLPFGSLGAGIILLFELLDDLPGLLDGVILAIQQARVYVVSSGLGGFLATINRLFPLYELSLMLGALITVKIALWWFRFVKSLIPFIG